MEWYKGIRFREEGSSLIGKKNGLIFWMHKTPGADMEGVPSYFVNVYEGVNKRLGTGGHRYFSREEAKEFCRQIAYGEIDMEALAREFEAETQQTVQGGDLENSRAAMELEGIVRRPDGTPANDGVCRDFTVWLGERGLDGKALRGVEKVVLPTVTTHDGYQDCPMVTELVFGRIEDAAELTDRMGQQCKLEIRAAVQDWGHTNAEREINCHSYIMECVPAEIEQEPLAMRGGTGLTVRLLVYRYTAAVNDKKLWDFCHEED